MPAKVMKSWQKATALVPLALLSGAWTANLTVTTPVAATVTAEDGPATLPDGTTVPTEAIKAPASVSTPGELAPGVPEGSASSVVSSASTNGIPAAALEAYQRAAQVINSAKPGCKISWELVAAIGRVESDHGRYGGNTLGDDGKSRPGIYGIPLDGTNNTARITDTDAGQFDDDQVYDRAVGPMQFIPGTWNVVGVDGDGDGERDPQDIDDASLATAVYLCSGSEDLSTRTGQESAVYRYNHSQEYVDLVLSIMNAYMEGDFSSVPNGTSSTPVFSPSSGDSVISPATSGGNGSSFGFGNGGGGSGGGGGGGGGGTVFAGSGGGSGGGSGTPAGGGPTTPAPTTPADPTPGPDPVQQTPRKVKKTVKDVVTPLEAATEYCQSQVSSTDLRLIGGMEGCIQAYRNGGAAAVQAAINAIPDPPVGGGGGGGNGGGGLL